MEKSGPNASFRLFFLGLGWPWAGEFVGFIMIFTCFPTQHISVNRKHLNARLLLALIGYIENPPPPLQLHSNPIAVSGSGHTGTQTIRRCHPYARKSASQAALSRMQLTVHATRRTPHGTSRLVLAVPSWSVKTRHASSRRCRGARVYGHMTTAMHDMSTPQPLLPATKKAQ